MWFQSEDVPESRVVFDKTHLNQDRSPVFSNGFGLDSRDMTEGTNDVSVSDGVDHQYDLLRKCSAPIVSCAAWALRMLASCFCGPVKRN